MIYYPCFTPDFTQYAAQEREFRQALLILDTKPVSPGISIVSPTILFSAIIGSMIPPSVGGVAMALNAIATNFLNQVRLEEQTHTDCQTWLQRKDQLVEKLHTLKKNLKVHNRLIDEHNDQVHNCHMSYLHCVDHRGTLLVINATLAYLSQNAQECQRIVNQTQAYQRINESLTDAERQIKQKKQPIDRFFIYSVYEPLVAQINNPSVPLSTVQRQSLTERTNGMMNRGYLAGVMDTLSSGDSPLLPSFRQSAIILGMSTEKQVLLFKGRERELRGTLKAHFDNGQHLALSLPEFMQCVQMWLLRSLLEDPCRTYKIPNDRKPLLDHQLSEIWRPLLRFEDQVCHCYLFCGPTILKNRVELGREGYGQQVDLQSIQAYANSLYVSRKRIATVFNTQLQPLMDHLAETIDFRTLIQNEASLSYIGRRLLALSIRDETIRTLLLTTENDWLKHRWKKRFGLIAWRQIHQPHLRISFEQGGFGKSNTLGNGVCMALNYTWSQQLQKHPTMSVTNLEQLLPRMRRPNSQNIQLPDSPIPRYIRLLQAMCCINDYIGTRSLDSFLSIPKHILDEDGVREEMIVRSEDPPITDIGDVIKLVMERNAAGTLSLKASNGVITIIGAGKRTHAMGMQIFEESRIYRHWDVNDDLSEYPSLHEMTQGFHSFIDSLYQTKFKRFYAIQYVNKS